MCSVDPLADIIPPSACYPSPPCYAEDGDSRNSVEAQPIKDIWSHEEAEAFVDLKLPEIIQQVKEFAEECALVNA